MRIEAYFDNNATTRLAPQALAAMLPYLDDSYANPSAAYADALGAATPMIDARRALARLFGDVGLADDFVLTSGASEANSWAVSAVPPSTDGPRHFVAGANEHPSLLAALAARERLGDVVDLARCDGDGVVCPTSLRAKLGPLTAFASFMLANNETGVIQPVSELAATVRSVAPAALVHVDATQAVGRINVSMDGDLRDVDLVSLSAHKFHGPKGMGALYVRRGLRIEPLIHGRGEDGRRGGTPDPSRSAALAVAADLAREGLAAAASVATLRDNLEKRLRHLAPRARVNGSRVPRLPNTSSVTIPGLDAPAAIDALASKGICVSDGAACSSGSPLPSHVLLAMGLSYQEARSTLRFSLSSVTSRQEVDMLIDALKDFLRASRGSTS